MPRKASIQVDTPAKSKQQTLLSFFNSSPPPSLPVTERISKSRLESRSSPLASPSQNRAGKRKRHLIEDDSEDEEGSADSDVVAIRFESKTPVVSDEETSPRRPAARKNKRSTRAASSTSSDTHVYEVNSEEENIGIPVRWKGKGKAKARQINYSDDDDEPRRRRQKLIRGVRPPTPEDDEDDILNENQIIEARFRKRDKKSQFQHNLEKLKRKKSGQPASESSSTTDEETAQRPFKGSKPGIIHDSDVLSDNDDDDLEDDFIVQDEAVAPAPSLPAIFSMNTYQDLTHHFKIICQLFVHMAVRPKFERQTFMEQILKEEEYFSVPLHITRRKLSGLRDSLVISSVWRPDFKQPLEEHPHFELTRLDFAIPSCDACHLGGRKSTLLGRVMGLPYNPKDFEPLHDSDSDSNVSSSEGQSEEVNDMTAVREFHLGRFCATRARVFHKFCHWEYSLYHALLREIDDVQGADNRKNNEEKFVRVAFFGGRQPPKDMKDADAVMDWLDQRQIIDMEWQKIREMMDSARNLEMAAKRGEDVDVD